MGIPALPSIWLCWAARVQYSVMAVVLAGGRSSRMGQDKATLYSPKLQATLIEQSKQLLSQLDDCHVVINSNTYPEAVKDIVLDCGPLSGIHAVLSHAQQHSDIQGFLFIPVDMPNLTAMSLHSLIQFAQQQGCAAYLTNSFLPCYLPAKANLLTTVNRQLHSKDWSIRQLLTLLAARSMPLPDASQLVNINDPTDWQQHCL